MVKGFWMEVGLRGKGEWCFGLWVACFVVIYFSLVAMQQVRGFRAGHGGHRRACGRKCSR
jgi:hypothetical protein